jgi:hypothetical protein
MRKFTGGKEILRSAPTNFATNFIALQSILAHKDELRAMVTLGNESHLLMLKIGKEKRLLRVC